MPLLTGEIDPARAARAIVDGGAKVCAVTLGSRGAYVCCVEGGRMVAPFAAEVIGTTGAGDSFWGGFLCAFRESGKAPGDLCRDDVEG